MTSVFSGAVRSVEEGPAAPLLDYSSISLGGSPNSYVEFPISDTIVTNDFSIAVIVQSAETPGGVILEYAENENIASVTERITDIVLWINSSATILEVFKTGHAKVGELHFNFQIVSTYQWVIVAFSYDQSNSELTLITSDRGELGKVRLISRFQLGLPGVLRVGADVYVNRYPAFHGYAACLNFYDGKLTEGEIPNILNECTDGTWKTIMNARTGKTAIQ